MPSLNVNVLVVRAHTRSNRWQQFPLGQNWPTLNLPLKSNQLWSPPLAALCLRGELPFDDSSLQLWVSLPSCLLILLVSLLNLH